MADVRDLLVRINGDTSGLEKAFGKATDKSKGFGRAMENAKEGSFALLGGLTAAAGGAAIFGKMSVDAFFAATEAHTKLATNLLNVQGNTRATVRELSDLASALQNVGVIEDDVIKAGMSQLATFNLQGKTIGLLTPKIADMVAQLKGHNATAEDMVTINNLVGKVMTGNVGALSRYGVTLSETQKEQLKSGDEAKRAATLVEVLGQNYGRVNEQLRQTPQGRITGLKNAFGDLQEGVGELVFEALAPMIEGFSNWIKQVEDAGGLLEFFTLKIEENKQAIFILGGAIAFALLPALYSIAVAAGTAILALAPFLIIGAAVGGIAYLIMQNWSGISAWFNNLWSNITSFATNAWTAIVNGLAWLRDNFWQVIGFIIGFFATLPIKLPFLVAMAIGKIIDMIIHVNWGAVFSGIGKAAAGVWEHIKQLGKNVFDFFKNTDWGSVFRNVAKGLGNSILGLLEGAINGALSGLPGSPKIRIPRFARGVNNFAGGLAILGEQGPELAMLPKGSDVFTASETRQMLRRGGAAASGSNQVTNLSFNPTFDIGMFAGMPTEYREIAERMWVEFTRIARSNGVDLPAIGVQVQ